MFALNLLLTLFLIETILAGQTGKIFYFQSAPTDTTWWNVQQLQLFSDNACTVAIPIPATVVYGADPTSQSWRPNSQPLAFDNDAVSCFAGKATAPGRLIWMSVQFPSPVTISCVKSSTATNSFPTWTLAVWDEISGTSVPTTPNCPNGAARTCVITGGPNLSFPPRLAPGPGAVSPTAAFGSKFLFAFKPTVSTWWNIHDLQLFTSSDCLSGRIAVPANAVLSCDSTSIPSSEIYKAFDESVSTFYGGKGFATYSYIWISVQLPSPVNLGCVTAITRAHDTSYNYELFVWNDTYGDWLQTSPNCPNGYYKNCQITSIPQLPYYTKYPQAPGNRVSLQNITIPSGVVHAKQSFTKAYARILPIPSTAGAVSYSSCAPKLVVGWTNSNWQGVLTYLTKQTDGNFASTSSVLGVCNEIYDVAFSPDCSQVYALCKAPSTAFAGAIDLVAPLVATHGLPSIHFYPGPSFLFLIRLSASSPSSPYQAYVVAKNLGDLFTPSMVVHGTKNFLTYIYAGNGQEGHTASQLFTINLATMVIDYYNFGDEWNSCGVAHTFMAQLSYNPVLDLVIQICTGDTAPWSIRSRVNKKSVTSNVIFNISAHPSQIPDGGFGGVVSLGANGWALATTHKPDVPTTANFAVQTTLRIVQLNADGTVRSSNTLSQAIPNWVVSYPQLAPLSNGNYLIGWGEMWDVTQTATYSPDDHYHLRPQRYVVAETTLAGVIQPNTLVTLFRRGWYDQYRWVSFEAKPLWIWAWNDYPVIGNPYNTNPVTRMKRLYSTTPASQSPILRVQTYTSGATGGAAAQNTVLIQEGGDVDPGTNTGNDVVVVSHSQSEIEGWHVALIVLASVAVVLLLAVLALTLRPSPRV